MENSDQRELLSSLVSNIKNYDGSDPLRPWLQGIRKMKESLPNLILKEKLPRFLQKCAQAFESDRRYRNDSRYLRVWVQLMDYVDDARVVLRRMEKSHIGLKRAMFYSAYAMYYEKHKKFEEAENMYRLGVQNLAEPVDELQKSYEQFLYRMKLLKERKARKGIPRGSRSSIIPSHLGKTKVNGNLSSERGEASQLSRDTSSSGYHSPEGCLKEEGASKAYDQGNTNMHLNKPTRVYGDDTVVAKFVGSAIMGKSEAENALHHGLVDPTVNMKEAMNAISSMFREPLETEPFAKKRTQQSKPKENQHSNKLEVFVDTECLEEGLQSNSLEFMKAKSQKPFVGGFKIWTEDDDDDDDDDENGDDETDDDDKHGHGLTSLSSSNISEADSIKSEGVRLTEDTVIRRFIGSTVFDDPGVENACHHGLVDPTVNLKEAMDDINSMFGKPLNFVRASRAQKQAKPSVEQRPASQGFTILADDEMEDDSRGEASKGNPSKFGGEAELYEPTVFTREAMAEINDMFGKPLDF